MQFYEAKTLIFRRKNSSNLNSTNALPKIKLSSHLPSHLAASFEDKV